MALTTDYRERKDTPIASGVLKYFPDALAEVARVSKIGNEQHNPGQPLHWAKEKSQDEHDALVRHLTDRLDGVVFDTDGARHSAKVAWRALAALQREIEAERAALEPAPRVEPRPCCKHCHGEHKAEDCQFVPELTRDVPQAVITHGPFEVDPPVDLKAPTFPQLRGDGPSAVDPLPDLCGPHGRSYLREEEDPDDTGGREHGDAWIESPEHALSE